MSDRNATHAAPLAPAYAHARGWQPAFLEGLRATGDLASVTSVEDVRHAAVLDRLEKGGLLPLGFDD